MALIVTIFGVGLLEEAHEQLESVVEEGESGSALVGEMFVGEMWEQSRASDPFEAVSVAPLLYFHPSHSCTKCHLYPLSHSTASVTHYPSALSPLLCLPPPTPEPSPYLLLEFQTVLNDSSSLFQLRH